MRRNYVSARAAFLRMATRTDPSLRDRTRPHGALPLVVGVNTARLLAYVAYLALAAGAQAQGTDAASLTDEFSRLSPKERARIARKEQEEARVDTAYQRVMARAEERFQQARYEDALAGYEQGRRMRPLNVYPKVKIQDIQALIKKRDEEVAKAAAIVPGTKEEPIVPAVVPTEPVATVIAPREDPPPPADVAPVPEAVHRPAEPAPLREKRTPAPLAAPIVRDTVRTARAEASNAPQREAVPQLPDGVRENRYREGNADVIERVVTRSGKSSVYKRTENKWGQVYYFEDGQPIDARVWKALFGDQEP